MSMQNIGGYVFSRDLTSVSARCHSWTRLKWLAQLRRGPGAGTGHMTFEWLRIRKLLTPDDSAVRALSSRALEKWRLRRRRVTKNQLSARYAQLIRICRKRGCSAADARDLVQEAHLRLLDYQRCAKIRDVDSLLRRIVINLSITHYHRKLCTPSTSASVEKLDRLGMLTDTAPGPEHTVAAVQRLYRATHLLSAVSTRTCQIFIAQRGGYSYEEIATAFGVKPRTVEKHVASAASILEDMTPAEFEEA